MALRQVKKTDFQTVNDAQLVLRYQKGRDERAFAEIVRRHGGMVRSVAKRLLDESEVDDAFQAAFFAFALRAEHLSEQVAVAGWLHRAAYSCSADILRSKRRRGDHLERFASLLGSAPEVSETNPSDHAANEELKRVIDRELARLPRDLRAAIVLCDLEGQTHKQAGEQLGVSSSTVSDRVAKARNRLRKRLIRQGITLSLGALASLAVATKESSAAITSSSIAQVTTNAFRVSAGQSIQDAATAAATEIANRVVTVMKTKKFINLSVSATLLLLLVGSVSSFLAPSNVLVAAEVFEDFRDGDLTDDAGLSWTFVGNQTIVPGEGLVLSSPDTNSPTGAVDMTLEPREGWSIRIQGRLSQDHGLFGAAMGEGPQLHNVTSDISAQGNFSLFDSATRDLVTSTVNFNGFDEDVVIQLDTFDGVIRLWVWPAEQPPAADIPAMLEADFDLPMGFPGMWNRSNDGPSEATFRWFAFATEHIPVTQQIPQQVPEPASAFPSLLGAVGVAWFFRRDFRTRNYG